MFYAILVKILVKLFIDTDKVIIKCLWKDKGTTIAKAILESKNKKEGIICFFFFSFKVWLMCAELYNIDRDR